MGATLPSSATSMNGEVTNRLSKTEPPLRAPVDPLDRANDTRDGNEDEKQIDGAKPWTQKEQTRQKTYAEVFAGVRQDSGDPKRFIQMMREFYDEEGIYDKKIIIFSDSLNVEKCVDYQREAEKDGRFIPTFGVGTFLTNDFVHASSSLSSDDDDDAAAAENNDDDDSNHQDEKHGSNELGTAGKPQRLTNGVDGNDDGGDDDDDETREPRTEKEGEIGKKDKDKRRKKKRGKTEVGRGRGGGGREKSHPMNIVIKLFEANGRKAVKISDNIGKNTGDEQVVRKVKERLGYVERET